jgi:hypothetical protein
MTAVFAQMRFVSPRCPFAFVDVPFVAFRTTHRKMPWLVSIFSVSHRFLSALFATLINEIDDVLSLRQLQGTIRDGSRAA